ILLFSNKSIVLSWDNKGSFLHVTWKGYANDQGYLDILAKQLELTKERKASKILYDLRNMGVVSQANQAYTNEKYFPSMSDAGNKKAAIIVPENIFGEVSVSAIMGKRNSELFEAEIFGELDTAREWLVS
ncbi:MAG: hypothetical protein AAFQ98_24155, partial [Bacteroidota bacterium]